MGKISVLHIGASGNRGGIESFIMNVCSHLDQEKYQLSLIADCDKAAIASEFEQLGGKIYYIPSAVKDKFGYIKGLWRVLDKSKFDIVHIHKNSLANPVAIYLCYFKGIKKIILHSHNTQPANVNGSIKAHNFFKKVTANMHLIRLACSEKAAEWMYPKNLKYELIYNGIDIDRFIYQEQIRENIRKQYNLENKLVIGCIGRLTYQKNHEFLINVFAEIHNKRPDSILIIIGDGVLKKDIEKLIINKKLQDAVLCLGKCNNTEKYYQAFDWFAFPSRYEGLGIVAIEAQISGTPVIASEFVPKEAKITNLMQFISLSNFDKWVEIISQTPLQKKKISYEEVKKSGYDIKDTAKKLDQIYFN